MPPAFRWYPDTIRQTSTGNLLTNLGVQPISAVFMTLRAKVTSANTATLYNDVANLLTSVNVLFDQEPVKIYGHGESAWVESAIETGAIMRALGKSPLAANNIVQMTIPILFGRNVFDPNLALPPRPAGRNVISYTVNATSGNATFVDLTIEELQLLNAHPTQFIKTIQYAFTPAATGETDIFLSLENGLLLGVILRVNTAPTGSTQTGDIDWVRFLLNNEVWGYYQVYWETLHSNLMGEIKGCLDFYDHTHEENTAAAYSQYATTLGPNSGAAFDKYGYLDFDYNSDGSLAPNLNVKQASVHPSFNTAAAQRVIQRTLISAS